MFQISELGTSPDFGEKVNISFSTLLAKVIVELVAPLASGSATDVESLGHHVEPY